MKELKTDSFKQAANDYLFLLNKNYPEKQTLKLVGDRYRLSGVQRTALYRGITSDEKARSRKAKLTDDLQDKKLYIDGYNILFTFMNYLLGKTLFIGNDGILRDAGETYGKIENEKLLHKAMDMLLDILAEKSGEYLALVIYLDTPVANSDTHLLELKKKMHRRSIEGNVLLVKSADAELKKLTHGVIATSDSEIIDAVPCQILSPLRPGPENNFQWSMANC
jgi:hypothetical protein